MITHQLLLQVLVRLVRVLHLHVYVYAHTGQHTSSVINLATMQGLQNQCIYIVLTKWKIIKLARPCYVYNTSSVQFLELSESKSNFLNFNQF